MKRNKNPAVVDLLKSNVVGELFGQAKDHVVKYYKKAGKKRRRNPEGEVLLSGDDVAQLTGGEFIPLKGIIVNEDSIQLITDPNNPIDSASVSEALSNPNLPHYYSRKMSSRAGARSATKRSGRTSVKNPVTQLAEYKVLDQDGRVRAQTRLLKDAIHEAKYLMPKLSCDMDIYKGRKKVKTIKWYR